MTDFSVSDFLRTSVYPNLDAVEAGLLDSLDPKTRTTSGSYPLTCPACKAKEGFYFPGSGYINCPRKKECRRSTSIWDAMLECGYTNGEIFKTLCAAANVEPPKPDQKGSSNPSAVQAENRIGKAMWQITQALATAHPAPLQQFQKERGYTNDQMAAMRLGYYSTAQDVQAALKAAGFSVEEAVARGYLEHDPTKPTVIWSSLAGRIIGYWRHEDGEIRLWGRLPTGNGDKFNKKYRFSKTHKKTIPYLIEKRHNTMLVCVEGTFDAWALQFAGIWGCALGGALINAEQALYLMARGVIELAHMVDGDTAGWDGAITSIRNCEGIGIITNIIPLGVGMDDPDAMVRAGKVDQLIALLDQKVNAGLYLAQMLRSVLDSTTPDSKQIHRIFATAECLTPMSRALFDKHVALLGYRNDTEFEAGKLFSALIGHGCTVAEAAGLVRRKTGYVITFTKEHIDG